jgi:outer membrane protein
MNAAVRSSLCALIFSAAAVCTGCTGSTKATIAPEPNRPWAVPETARYAAASATYPEGTRGSGNGVFAAPSIEPDKVYELAELIDIAERSNPETRIAWESARQAALSTGMAESAYAPVLAASAAGAWQLFPVPIPTTLVPQGWFNTKSEFAIPLLTLKWLVFDFGGREASVDAARELLASANFTFNATHQKIVFDVTRAYYSLNEVRGRVDVASAALSSAKTVEDAVESRRARGLATLPELLQAQEQSARAAYDVQEARTGETDARLALLGAMGVRPTTPLRVASLTARPLPAALEDSAEKFVDRALAQRPDLLARLASIRAREAEVRKAKSEFYPRIAVGGNVGQNIGRFSVQGIPGWSGVNEPTFGASISIEVPLYDGGLRRDRAAIAESQRRVAEEDFVLARDNVVRDVIKAYDDLKLALRKREAAASLLLAAQNSYGAAVDSYRSGIATFLDVSSAQVGLTRARIADANTHIEVLATAAALAFSTGDIAPDNPTASPPAQRR